ncbi:hypothetical protein SAMN03159343_1338 [Klenkia marina]|uniref:Uncharacterized protein n=1 Tax=Klenkia marina TaxID=1960309 RepID=A0A1G4XSP2_9ACTN|nr:hypothetical protein [Klenkia marina]SCX44010.1 hypothetical protein SAMN03159343_1338 [Klenkia marina]
MPYSLVSAATLGFDLVRLPGGPDVAAVLLAGLGATPEHLRGWAAHHPVVSGSAAQRTRWSDRAARIRETAAAGVVDLRTARAHPEARTEALVALLEQGTIGDAASLERLLREDVLGPESAAAVEVGTDVRELAADVLADAAVAGWAAAAVADRDRRAATALVEKAGPVPPPDLGPATGALLELADGMAASDEVRRGRWRVAVDEVREARRSWAAAMHGAAWAAHVSGRTRALGTSQLLAVGAFRAAGFTPGDGARGVWNAFSGVVQGVAMADLLDTAALEQLLLPWLLAEGSHPTGVHPTSS